MKKKLRIDIDKLADSFMKHYNYRKGTGEVDAIILSEDTNFWEECEEYVNRRFPSLSKSDKMTLSSDLGEVVLNKVEWGNAIGRKKLRKMM